MELDGRVKETAIGFTVKTAVPVDELAVAVMVTGVITPTSVVVIVKVELTVAPAAMPT